MSIKSASYLKSVVPGASLPYEKYPVYAFIGRSNVGKSSFINAVTQQKNLCRSGSTPGVTRKVNLYLINKNRLFADLPGYGFSKLSIVERKKLLELIFWYLENQENDFRQIYLLIDAKIGPTEQDLEIIDYLIQRALPLNIVLSKIDKLTHSQKINAQRELAAKFPGFKILPFSAHSREGLKEILQNLDL
jgi:GTP-binding protein